MVMANPCHKSNTKLGSGAGRSVYSYALAAVHFFSFAMILKGWQ